jgi:hypothetical protein
MIYLKLGPTMRTLEEAEGPLRDAMLVRVRLLVWLILRSRGHGFDSTHDRGEYTLRTQQ